MKSAKISTFLKERIDAGDFPSAVYLVAKKGEIVFQDPRICGRKPGADRDRARFDPMRREFNESFGNGSCSCRTIDKGLVDLDANVNSYVDEFKGHEEIANDTGIADSYILASCLAAFLPISGFPRRSCNPITRESVLEESQVLYSDLNFLLLQAALERRNEITLDSIAQRDLFKPSGLVNSQFNPNMQQLPQNCSSGIRK